MPALSSETLTIESFEDRMRLRRRMFARCGVSVAALHAARDLDAVAKRSVETCLGCAADADCARWLDGATMRDGAPAFCANQSLIAALQTGKRLRSGRA